MAKDSPVYCLYYQGCGRPAQVCGYCVTHCMCTFKAIHVGRPRPVENPFDPNKIQVLGVTNFSAEVADAADAILDEVIREVQTEADQPASGEGDGRSIERDASEGSS